MWLDGVPCIVEGFHLRNAANLSKDWGPPLKIHSRRTAISSADTEKRIRSYLGLGGKAMRRRTISVLVMMVAALLVVMQPAAQAEDAEKPNGKLMVVWTSADPDVADKVCLMYTHAAKKYGWFAEVHLVVWGPSQRLLVGDPALQAKVKAMQEDGVIVEACVACARKLELVEELQALGLEVHGMGVPLTEALKDPETEVLTF